MRYTVELRGGTQSNIYEVMDNEAIASLRVLCTTRGKPAADRIINALNAQATRPTETKEN